MKNGLVWLTGKGHWKCFANIVCAVVTNRAKNDVLSFATLAIYPPWKWCMGGAIGVRPGKKNAEIVTVNIKAEAIPLGWDMKSWAA